MTTSHTPKRPCIELGTCRDCVARGLLCENDPNPWQPDEVECTPMERIGYWATLTVLTCLSVGTVVGIGCFIAGRWFS